MTCYSVLSSRLPAQFPYPGVRHTHRQAIRQSEDCRRRAYVGPKTATMAVLVEFGHLLPCCARGRSTGQRVCHGRVRKYNRSTSVVRWFTRRRRAWQAFDVLMFGRLLRFEPHVRMLEPAAIRSTLFRTLFWWLTNAFTCFGAMIQTSCLGEVGPEPLDIGTIFRSPKRSISSGRQVSRVRQRWPCQANGTDRCSIRSATGLMWA